MRFDTLRQDCYEKKLISVEKIHTDLNVADLLTKPFDGPRFNYLVVSIGNDVVVLLAVKSQPRMIPTTISAVPALSSSVSFVQPTPTTTPPPPTTSSPPVSTIPDIQPTLPPSPQIPSPSYHDTNGPIFDLLFICLPPPSHEP
ncbi:hypothetical protein Tco_1492879 [Tanacetum coccineum]